MEIALREIFDKPTVEMLSEEIERELKAGRGLQAPPIPKVSRESRLPLSFSQQRLWFLDQLTPASPAYNVLLCVRLEGELQLPALERSLSQMIRRHESLRTVFRVQDGEPAQVIEPAREIDLDVLDLTNIEPERRERRPRRWSVSRRVSRSISARGRYSEPYC